MEYEILGGTLPVVVCKLTKGESIVTQSGGMGWMTNDFKLHTNIKGGIIKGIERKFTKESFFQTTYTCMSEVGTISFPSDFPGSIIAYELAEGESIIAHKSAFLCAESTVSIHLHFKPKVLFGIFGGEGFILQKITGPGKVFLDIDGSTVKHILGQGESILVDSGHIASMSPTIGVDMTFVRGILNLFFAGEGIFLVELTGPGEVVLQTMPIMNMAKALAPYLNIKPKKRKEKSNAENTSNE